MSGTEPLRPQSRRAGWPGQARPWWVWDWRACGGSVAPLPKNRYAIFRPPHKGEVMTTVHPDGLPVPQRYLAIATIVLGVTMAVMDSAIANVALPTIARDLHTDPALSIWIVNGYQLAVTISLLPL